MTKPRSSNAEVVELLTALRLDIEHDPKASGELDDVVVQLCGWYADHERARAAKVCVEASPVAFSSWLGRPVPEGVEDEALAEYVADTLMIAADHSADVGSALQLFASESEGGTLYLLRAANERRELGDQGWWPTTSNHPDTEAALGGIYRFDGCRPAFTDHAAGCERCLARLKTWDLAHGLPEGWEHLRRWPVPVREKKPELPPLPPVSGVGIVIKRKS